MANTKNLRQEANTPKMNDPAVGAVPFTGTADVTLAVEGRYVYVAVAGNLEVDMIDGSHVTYVGLLAGTVYPFAVAKIYDAGTTCSGHVLL